jgi:hypothetical protein
VSSGRINPEGSRFTIAHTLAATQISGSYKPLYSVRLPALRQINFELSPVPYRGNVVAQINCSERTLSDHQCLLKTTNSFILHESSSLFQKPFLKTFQWSRYYSKVFEDIFKKSFECSHPRVFGSTRGFPKALLLINKPLLQV